MWNVTTFIRLYLESSALFSKGMIVQLVILFSLLVSGCSSPGLKPVTFSPEPVVRSNKSASIKFQTVHIDHEQDSISAWVVINPNIVIPVYSLSRPEHLFTVEDQRIFVESLSSELNRLGILKISSLNNLDSEHTDISISIFFEKTYYSPRLGEYLLDVVMLITDQDTDKNFFYKYHISSPEGDSFLEKMKATVPREKLKAAQKLMNRVIPDIESWLKRLEPVTNAEAFENFTQTFYFDPRPELIDSALRYVSSSEITLKKSAEAPLIMSFSCMFSRYDTANNEKWKSTINDLTEPAKSLLTKSINNTPVELLATIDESPAKNDMNWACFFATGDILYFNNIAANLKYLDERKDLNRYLTAASAKWSLASNAKRHMSVRMAIEDMKSRGVPEIRLVAEDMLTKDPRIFLEEMKSVVKVQRDKGGWSSRDSP